MQKTEYHIFTLRLWRDSPQDPWRLAIQGLGEPAPMGLASAEALTAFVKARMKADSGKPLEGNDVEPS